MGSHIQAEFVSLSVGELAQKRIGELTLGK